MHPLAAPAFAGALLTALAVTAPAQQVRYRDAIVPSVDVRQNLIYGSAVVRWSGRTQKLRLDLYQPAGDLEPKRAALLLLHGGGFFSGSKSEPVFVQLATDLARRGYVVASVDYRLRQARGDIDYADVVDASHDMKAAVRWLRRYANAWRIDPARIACLGASAGAITCLETAYVPGAGSSGNPGYPSRVLAVVNLWGFLWDESTLDPQEAPVCIVHGTNDPQVSFARALALRDAAVAAGVPHELHAMQGVGHGDFAAYLARHHDDSLAFLYEQLLLGQRSGLTATAKPGEIAITTCGVAGDFWAPMVAAQPAAHSLGILGTLALDPATMRVLTVLPLPAGPRLPISTLRIPVIGRKQPKRVAIQAVHGSLTGSLRLLTNGVVTQ
ncbi:MAG: alpha/beta hydrolase [Planctomycetota bacterium]